MAPSCRPQRIPPGSPGQQPPAKEDARLAPRWLSLGQLLPRGREERSLLDQSRAEGSHPAAPANIFQTTLPEASHASTPLRMRSSRTHGDQELAGQGSPRAGRLLGTFTGSESPLLPNAFVPRGNEALCSVQLPSEASPLREGPGGPSGLDPDPVGDGRTSSGDHCDLHAEAPG